MKRDVWPIILLLTGSGALLYGSFFHVVMVAEEKEREVSIAIPAISGLAERPPENRGQVEAGATEEERGAGDGGTSVDGDPFRSPPVGGNQPGNPENPFESPSVSPMLPATRFEKVTEKFLAARAEPEWVIVREVTVGGVTRLDSDQLKRTYSGKAPSLCPT
jgi:hypothetical protein